MTRGMNSYEDKQRRKMRRRNHIARDLAKPQFRQKIKEVKRKDYSKYTTKDWLDELDGE